MTPYDEREVLEFTDDAIAAYASFHSPGLNPAPKQSRVIALFDLRGPRAGRTRHPQSGAAGLPVDGHVQQPFFTGPEGQILTPGGALQLDAIVDRGIPQEQPDATSRVRFNREFGLAASGNPGSCRLDVDMSAQKQDDRRAISNGVHRPSVAQTSSVEQVDRAKRESVDRAPGRRIGIDQQTGRRCR